MCVYLVVVVFCSFSLCSLSREGVDACLKTCNLVGGEAGRRVVSVVIAVITGVAVAIVVLLTVLVVALVCV